MVVSEGHRMVRSGVCLCRLVGFLRQYRHDECDDRVVISADVLYVDFRCYLCFRSVFRLEAQPLYVSEAICGVGPLFYLLPLRRCEPTRSEQGFYAVDWNRGQGNNIGHLLTVRCESER